MATPLKDYLEKYQLIGDEDKQPKKSKKKWKVATKVPEGLIIIDNDAAWQKRIDESLDESEVEGDRPQVIEDVEVKRMHQMERVKQHRPYMSIGDDGSGWSTIDRKSKDAQQTSNTLCAASLGASPLRRDPLSSSQDISLPRRNTLDVYPPMRGTTPDISPPKRRNATDAFPSRRIPPEDTSPRKRKPQTDSLDMSPPRKKSSRANPLDTSRPRKMIDGRQAGLITSKERAAELLKKKQEDARRLRDLEGGRQAAETIYRDKRGKRLEGLEDLLRQQQGEVKPEAKPLEWGKGLAQKREVEEQHAEVEVEKVKPFARTRDDPELDKMYKEQVRWGDPMVHFVKRKDLVAELVDLKATEEMKESGFIIPQDVPKRSWLKGGVQAPMNRYGIKPGRHWDGANRSTGFESQMFKAKAEKQATGMEAYLWSVSNI